MQIREKTKIELLAPAGDREKLEIAIHYGADAVYLGGKDFSLRNFSGNFSLEDLDSAIRYAHRNTVKVYLACNVYPRESDLKAIGDYLKRVGNIKPDAIIIADPGIFMLARDTIPHIPIHLSTQANTTHSTSVRFWERQGAKRVNVARELTLEEIKAISVESAVEIEAFVHGAMCIAYSGRCLLSSYMTYRDSNRGNCSHSCRWKYALVEATRPGGYVPIEEDDRGSYILSSRDLCMVEHIDDMIEAGVKSLKIEGRMKGINYLSIVVKTYREAIDRFYENPIDYQPKEEWRDALAQVNYRGYCTGFYYGDPSEVSPNYAGAAPVHDNSLVGKVRRSFGSGQITIETRNKIFCGEAVAILKPRGPLEYSRIEAIIDEEGHEVPFAQPGNLVHVKMAGACSPNDIIRKNDKQCP